MIKVGQIRVSNPLITCSTMNRAAATVREAMAKHRVPVIQIDETMMEAAIEIGDRILVIATHGPTVKNTQDLLCETAERLARPVSFAGATVEEAFHLLGAGEIVAHNELIASAIREASAHQKNDAVVLAQLSMSVFKLSYPDCISAFGMPVLTSGETGFERAKLVLKGEWARH